MASIILTALFSAALLGVVAISRNYRGSLAFSVGPRGIQLRIGRSQKH